MIHKKCGGRLVINCNDLFLIQSPSIKITAKGIVPGPVEISSNKNKTGNKIVCSQCQQEFCKKEEFENEILEPCSICRKEYPPSEIQITEYNINLCIHCINRANSSKLDATKIQDKMLALYGEVLKKGDNPTLLTILMKK